VRRGRRKRRCASFPPPPQSPPPPLSRLSILDSHERIPASSVTAWWYTEDMIIPVGFGQITFGFGGVGLPTGAACTLGFSNEGELTAQEAADAAAVAWVAAIPTCVSSAVVFTGTLCKLGPDSTGPSAISPASQAGALAGTSVSPNVCFLVHKQTAMGGRQGRGRMFIPGPLEGDVGAEGSVSGTRLTNLAAELTEMRNALITAGMTPVVLHNNALTPTGITSLAPDALVATQRRRLRR
jgi:hypothetical protein